MEGPYMQSQTQKHVLSVSIYKLTLKLDQVVITKYQ